MSKARNKLQQIDVVRHWERFLRGGVDVLISASAQGWFEWSSEQPGPWQAGLGLDDL